MSDRIECATQPAIQLPTSQQASCAFLTQVQMLTIKFRCNVYLRIKKKLLLARTRTANKVSSIGCFTFVQEGLKIVKTFINLHHSICKL